MHTEIQNLIRPVIESLKLIYWGLEIVSGGNKPTVRVYIDKENGVDVDDCAKVSREIGATLEVEDVPAGEYTLEVSSPGIDRTLFRLDQFPAYIGQALGISLVTAVEGRRRYKGTLKAINADVVTLSGDEHSIDLPFHKIKRARLLPDE